MNKITVIILILTYFSQYLVWCLGEKEMIKKLDHFVLTVKNIEKTTLLKKENARGILF
ncbi:biphenyl-2,3-diol 1,2-dioxygenase III-related protein [Priestia megaterium]|nr:biphenyl-2,3-diol 1,2-dioxygenase III-related protein [Priestia megaterium]